jgi:hypothetical protein
MSKSSTHPKSTSGKYNYFSYEETAYILNWNDYCLINDLNFQQTISERMKKKLGTVRSWGQISNKLRSLLKSYLKLGNTRNIHNVLEEGTRCFQVEWFGEKLLEQLILGRNELGIRPLGEEYITKSEYRAASIGTRPVSGSIDLCDYADVQKACRSDQWKSQYPQSSLN